MAKGKDKPAVKPITTRKAKPVKKVVRKPKKTEIDYLANFEYVCLEIEKGKSLRRACPAFMSVDKFLLMCKESKGLNERYARAYAIKADNIFEDIINIADDNSKDVYYDENGVERTDNDVIQRSRLRVEARKWALSKMAPKKYGDKLDLTSDNEKIKNVTIFRLPYNGRK